LVDCCLVALALVSDLLLWAKHLFVRAMVAIVPAEIRMRKGIDG
jgi:hypothetical protein